MLLFHGTTYENALNILKKGFDVNANPNWNCSRSEVYFFNGDYIKESGDLESNEEIIQQGIQEALGQALITCAVQNPSDYRGAVLVFDSSLMKNQRQIKPDTSCENMENVAVCLTNPEMDALIGFYVMTDDYKEIRYFTLAQMKDNQYLNEVELSGIEESMIKLISESSSSALENLNDYACNIDYKEINYKLFLNNQKEINTYSYVS